MLTRDELQGRRLMGVGVEGVSCSTGNLALRVTYAVECDICSIVILVLMKTTCETQAYYPSCSLQLSWTAAECMQAMCLPSIDVDRA